MSKILAIDLGKNNSAVCLFDRGSLKSAFQSVRTRKQAIYLPIGKRGWTQKALKPIRALALPVAEITTPEDIWKGQLRCEFELLDGLVTQLKTLESKLDALGKEDEKVKRLRTIPGVGPRLSEAVVAILDDPHRFKNGRHVGSYVGMVPRRWQSGQVDITGRISKCGNKLLRTLLVEVSWLGLKEPWMREIYDKVRRGHKKRSKIAIVAVARQLLVRCWAILRDKSYWDADHAAKFVIC